MSPCARCGLPHAAGRACPVLPALPVNAGTTLPRGTLVGGRFRIEQVTHRSGMSTVYQAVDVRNHGMGVALKELNAAGLSDAERAEALTWLAREAGLLSTLHDPRLPALVAAAGEGDRHYVAMPFLRGETMEERIVREGPQSELLVLDWARELAALLRYLHGQDPPVIHRDLKPANVLIRPTGSIALLDLGVARSLARGVPGTAVGTPGYAPPEQYQGLADERSDLYALGATLHRALTGYNPNLEAPFRHPPVRELRPEVSEETAALVAGLLVLAPAARPESAPVVLAGVQAATRSAFARAYQPVHRMYTRMQALLVLALAVGTVIYTWAFGVPTMGGGAAAYTARDPGPQALLVLAVFAPGLLTLLPLASRELRILSCRHGVPRRHRAWAARLVLITWAMPLIVWLINLWDQKQGNLTAVPGHAPAAAGVAAGSILIALAGLTALRQDLRGLRKRLIRLPGRLVVVGMVACLWPLSTALQQPYFLGACYAAPVQSEEQTQFSAIQSVSADQGGDLYVLDSYGLRERTADDRFHLLLDFAEPSQTPSPFYSPVTYTQMSVSPDGLVAVGNPATSTVYRLTMPGRVAVAARAPYLHGGMALGRGGVLYLSSPKDGRIDVYAPNHPNQPTALRPHPLPAHWQPEALSLDFHGNLYVVDLGARAIEQISPDGQLRKVAWMNTNGVNAALPASLTQVTGSFGPGSTLYVSIAGSPTLIFLPDKRIGVRQPIDYGTSATQSGDMVYVASGYYLAAWQGVPNIGPMVEIGGAATPSQVCKADA